MHHFAALHMYLPEGSIVSQKEQMIIMSVCLVSHPSCVSTEEPAVLRSAYLRRVVDLSRVA